MRGSCDLQCDAARQDPMYVRWGQELGGAGLGKLGGGWRAQQLYQLSTAAIAHPGGLMLQHFPMQEEHLDNQTNWYLLANLQLGSNLVFTATVR